MKSPEIITKIIALSQQPRAINSFKNEYEIEHLLKGLLVQDPKNIDLWMSLAVLYSESPWADCDLSYQCLEKVYEVEPENPRALLFYVYSYDIDYGMLPDDALERLSRVNSTPEINSMARYMMIWSEAAKEDEILWEKILLESIGMYQKHVYNYSYLASTYFRQGRITEACQFMERAIKNVVKIYDSSYSYDRTDIDEYLHQHVSGIYKSQPNYERLQERLEEYKKSL